MCVYLDGDEPLSLDEPLTLPSSGSGGDLLLALLHLPGPTGESDGAGESVETDTIVCIYPITMCVRRNNRVTFISRISIVLSQYLRGLDNFDLRQRRISKLTESTT